MLSARLLLFGICIFFVKGDNNDTLYIEYDDYNYTTAAEMVFDFDWLIELLQDNNLSDACDSNPCFNGGSCITKSNNEFECLCNEPYVGKWCQKVRNVCENVTCGRGSCVVDMKNPPYYKCKCRPPYTGPNCLSRPNGPCDPNPCQNGARCIPAGRKRMYCACPAGFTGKFCEAVPGDCYIGNGESYRGVASITVDNEECLDWNDYSIVYRFGDPLQRFESGGLGDNNHCRNPDGDMKPWCYVRREWRLASNYCKVRKCIGAVAAAAPTVPPSVPPTVPPTPTSMFSQCGTGTLKKNTRIYGGTKATPGSNPWQASVQNRDSGSWMPYSHICGGILISSCWVLTAGHCIVPGKEYQVVLGGIDIFKQEENVDQTIAVTDIYRHEDYRETPESVHNDIALLKLQITDYPYCAKETKYVKTACLPNEAFPAAKKCVISGWGATETNRYSQQLLNTDIFIISNEKCRAPHVYGTLLDDSMFCAGVLQGGVDSCQGDSGGPLVCEKDDVNYVAGVVSWGKGCGVVNKPGVYANVLKFKDWIINKMRS